ncbi:hypothetical protein [Prevotella nigrescens]|uniref:hypothetical protein n=1 Tax=Prevotella nigrescens TaxID=28133 RepID=UPI0028DB8A4F|nr:hypothetical protein [Prevotella nigrescens]
MATILETLKGVSAYPVPLRTFVETAEFRGLSLTGTATQEVMVGKAYKLAKADLLLWLSLAPNIGQGGQSFSFTDEQRQQFRNQAKALYDECGEVSAATKPIYGYKGSRL